MASRKNCAKKKKQRPKPKTVLQAKRTAKKQKQGYATDVSLWHSPVFGWILDYADPKKTIKLLQAMFEERNHLIRPPNDDTGWFGCLFRSREDDLEYEGGGHLKGTGCDDADHHDDFAFQSGQAHFVKKMLKALLILNVLSLVTHFDYLFSKNFVCLIFGRMFLSLHCNLRVDDWLTARIVLIVDMLTNLVYKFIIKHGVTPESRLILKNFLISFRLVLAVLDKGHKKRTASCRAFSCVKNPKRPLSPAFAGVRFQFQG